MTDSTWNDPRITAYLFDELSPAEREAFENEIQSNADLAAAVAEARDVTAKLGTLYAAEIEATPRTSSAAILDALDSRTQQKNWFTPNQLKLATAACIALLILGVSIPVLRNSAPDQEIAMVVKPEAELAEQHDVMMLAESDAETEPASEPLNRMISKGKREEVEDGEFGRAKSGPIASAPIASAPIASEGMEEDMFGMGGGMSGMPMDSKLEPAAPTPNSGDRDAASPASKTENGIGNRSAALGYDTPLESHQVRPSRAARGLQSYAAPPSQPTGYGLAIDEGRGPGIAGDRFDPIDDNSFRRVSEHPLSTFSVDVDTASYSKVRDFLLRAHSLPRPDAVRAEEMINYFDYDAEPPAADSPHPFSVQRVITACPWNSEHRLARITIKGKEMAQSERPKCNLVFLIDTSGSMNAANKLPLVQQGMKMLIEQLNEDDQVAIVVYAGSAGRVLNSTKVRSGKKIRRALTQLSAGGSTNGGQGITLAYQTARDNFISGGVNRVILCSDGDFNVGTTGTDELVQMVESEAKGGIFLSVLGFGMGNHNDAMLEQISGRGNGNYAFIDTEKEAKKVLVDQTSGTLVTIAKDVKLQVEFNPAKVASYRLIGYENRMLAKEDFNDDKKDAGEIGAGHTVTALYEIVPAGIEADASQPKVDELKYQSQPETTIAAQTGETMTLKLRYKKPDGDDSTLIEFPVVDEGGSFADADNDTRFAAAVAGFAMQLRSSDYRGSWTLGDVIRVAKNAKGNDRYELKAEFVQLAEKANELMGE